MKNKNTVKNIFIIVFFLIIILFFAVNSSEAAYTSTDINGINTSKYPGYKELLQAIKSKHPNWTIKLYYTGLDWNTVIANENTGHGTSPKSLIYDTYDESWRCQEPGCKGVKYDVSKRWYCASKQAIEYMMDPRNSLDESYIFQFQDLSSSVGDRNAVKKMVEGTFLNEKDSYLDAIMEAAKTEGISPFHIVSRIVQEQGNDGSGRMNGYPYRTPSGETVLVYNLFNINVSGNNTEEGLLAGAKYAYEQGWTSVEASIKGGAKFIKDGYINQGQTTLYFQKYDVIENGGLYNHQYMQNIRAANDEGNIMYNSYKKNNILNSSFEFTIPVYENMPKTVCPRPKYKPVTQITTEKDSYEIKVNESINIGYGYSPTDATNTNFTWTSSDPEVLSVYWNKIRGLKPGTAELIIRTDDGTVEKRVKITVKSDSTVIPDKNEYTIELNQAIDINCKYTPSGTTAEDFTWTAEDPSILSVYWNRVRGLKSGSTNLIIKSMDGTFVKKVKINVILLTVSQNSYEIDIDEAIDIKCTYEPKTLNSQDFIWTAEDPNILSVYWDRIRGIKAGTTNLIIKSKDGTYTKKIKVTVNSDEISVNPSKEAYEIGVNEAIDIECTYTPSGTKAEDFTWTYEIGVNEAIDIKCTYTPSGTKAEDFTWTAEDPSILSVYWNRVRGLKVGTTNIIVKSLDGTYTKKIKVTVKNNKTMQIQEINTDEDSKENSISSPEIDDENNRQEIIKHNEKTDIIDENEEKYVLNVDEELEIDTDDLEFLNDSSLEDFIWETEDTDIISVDYNKVIGLKEGTTNILIKSKDGTCIRKIEVIVKDKIS